MDGKVSVKNETILTLDIETWKSKHFAFGVIYDPTKKTHRVFYSINEMKDYLLSLIDERKRAKRYKIYGHNISYDLNWIFDNFELYFKNEWVTEKNNRKRYWKRVISRDGKLYECRLHNLYFLDTLNLFPLSLAKAGEVVGHKKDLDIRKKFETTDTPGEITLDDINYCLSDCIITYKILMKLKNWVESHGGKLKRTLASSALSILTNYNTTFKNYLKQLNSNYTLSNFDERFRNAYFGGRTECYNIDAYNLNYYDINSLYPYVMANSEMQYPDPTTLFKYKGNILDALNEYEGMAKVKLHCPKDIKIPVLPLRVKNMGGINDGKIIYPTGTFWGEWCFPELRKAYEMGYSFLDSEFIIVGKKVKSQWTDYILDLYAERKVQQDNKSPLEKITKLFLNTSYGKFGQRDYENRIISMEEADEIYDDNTLYDVIFYKGEPFVRYKTEASRSRSDILCLASYVTSHARTELYSYYQKCHFDVMYSDTDSLITHYEFKTSKELGGLKLEAEIKYASFKGRKDYFLELTDGTSIIRRKGCSLKMVNKLIVNGESIIIDKHLKIEFENKNPEITKLYHDADILHIEKILQSRESLIRGLDAGKSFQITKERKKKKDDGRLFGADELSNPYNIFQDESDNPFIIIE